jgi:ubiquinone/menaquinone biosynthesis C-methylase UbiE
MTIQAQKMEAVREIGRTGSVTEFDKNWQDRKETHYNHWVRGTPKNQIQLAFRNHWLLFSEVLRERNGGNNFLEVGCGRGSLSSYFADHGYACTLLDTSPTILKIAEGIFAKNNHKAKFVEGNALSMNFPDNSFDVVASIGLLEHFEDIDTAMKEQYRVLKPGGTLFAYIVPERPDNVQKRYLWINKILKKIARFFSSEKVGTAKSEVFRSDYGSERYLPVIRDLQHTDLIVSGMYPLPMISHSPEFPFSLLPKPVEFVITRVFSAVLAIRKILYKKNPWMCEERFGQAFLVSFRKA